ncbi:MAG: PEP-CTERM sorting domain-containing protein [Sedimentisphaerales bacterium]
MRHSTICTAILLSIILAGSSPAAEWSAPVAVTSVNTQYDEWTPYLSYDGLSLYFAQGYSNDSWEFQIFEAKRNQPSGPFTSVNKVYQSYSHVIGPWVSQDNLRMYYHQETAWTIRMSERASVNDPWSEGTILNLDSLNAPLYPSLTADELTMVFDSADADNRNIYLATRTDRNSDFNIQYLSELNTSADDFHPTITPNGLTMYFCRDDGIYSTTRASLSSPFGNIQHLPINLPGMNIAQPKISWDGTAMYFCAAIPGQPGDIYVSYLVPEPATILLLGLGAAFIAKRRR